MEAILGIIIAALLSENFILVKFYGICPFMGVSKKIDTALGMGMAVTFVMAIASAACFVVNLLLEALSLQYMQTVAFILVIASIVQVVEMFLKKMIPALYKALGVFLPLITTNCAVLGVVLVNVQEGYNFLVNLLLVNLQLQYMQTVAFILVIASIVQVVEMFLKKAIPALYKALGVFLPLITTNCAVLGVVLVNVQEGYNFLISVVNGAAGGLGFTLAIVLFASIRERVDKADPPESFKGYPIALIAAGLLALAFMGFSGLSIT